MLLKRIGLAAGAAALIAAPVTLQAQVSDRATAPVEAGQELGGSDTILGVLAGAILVTFIVLTAVDDDDEPVSP